MGLFKFIKDTIDRVEEERKQLEDFKKQCEQEGVDEYGFVEVKSKVNLKRKIDRFIAFDLETTGFSEINDRIIEISAIKFENGEIVDKFQSLINPKKSIPKKAMEVNNITDRMVKYAPDAESVIWKFAMWIGDARTGNTVLVAHNAEFDMKFLRHYFHLYKIPATIEYKDTLSMSRRILPHLENHKLGTVAKYFNIENMSSHRAESDAETCGRIFIQLHNASIKKKNTKL